MLREKRIYCIEGHWDYGKREVEPSVEPVLQMLRGLGQWEYARRDCATVEEMNYWIEHEWTRCKQGSLLYFATHGEGSGRIWLSNDHSLHMTEITANCTNCWVHFGGCNVLDDDVPEETIREFMENTGATVVSGYAVETGWADVSAPALALELTLFSSITDIPLDDGQKRRKLNSIRERLDKRFPDCGLRLHTKKSTAR